jgi:hypothetical protein
MARYLISVDVLYYGHFLLSSELSIVRRFAGVPPEFPDAKAKFLSQRWIFDLTHFMSLNFG